jgi:hypothetical protein
MEKNLWSEYKILEFDRRISEIHRPGMQFPELRREDDMSIRHQEFQAMADVFLGADYDKEKLRQVEGLQFELRDVDAWLFTRYDRGDMNAMDYVGMLNEFASIIFEQCEKILGEHGFEQFFGAPLSERQWLLDERTFLEAHSKHH